MKNHIITALDIGTSVIKALAVRGQSGQDKLEVLAQVEEPSFGVRKGVVANPEEVSQRIYRVLSQIQQGIGQKINSVYVSIGGAHISAISSQGLVSISRADQIISQEDVDRVVRNAQTFSLPSNRQIVAVFPKKYIVDGAEEVKEVLGMRGVRLETEVLALCAFSPYLKNLTEAVLNCGLQIDDLMPSPLASARAVLTPRQKELGAAVLDIGAGTTSLAAFKEGDLIYLSILPVGSANITNDIAIWLKIDIDVAEQIKKEYGSCVVPSTKKNEKIKLSSEDSALIFSRKMLVKIIEARVSEIFKEVQKELKQISGQNLLPGGVVLTGGGVGLSQIVELAKKELHLPCRIGKINKSFEGLTESPAFAVACGLVLRGVECEEGGEIDTSTLKVFVQRINEKLKKVFKVFIP